MVLNLGVVVIFINIDYYFAYVGVDALTLLSNLPKPLLKYYTRAKIHRLTDSLT